MGTVKLKSAEEYRDEYLVDLTGMSTVDWLKSIQRNAIEYALQTASENAEADWEPLGWLQEQHRQLTFIGGEDYEVYVINSSITSLKDEIFKLNGL